MPTPLQVKGAVYSNLAFAAGIFSDISFNNLFGNFPFTPVQELLNYYHSNNVKKYNFVSKLRAKDGKKKELSVFNQLITISILKRILQVKVKYTRRAIF